MTRYFLLLLVAVALGRQPVTPATLLQEDVPPPDYRIQYGPGELQVGELRLPKNGKPPHAVAILVHGGCWAHELPKLDARAVTLDLLRPMAAALADSGIATWNVEYRRAGHDGGIRSP